MFVGNRRIPVSDDNGNVVYIREKMDFGTRNRVTDEFARISTEGGMAMHAGAYGNALMVHNIVAWEGPDFKGVPCTPENIYGLDPDEPLVEKVLDEIAKRNPLNRQGTDPKSSTNGTGSTLTERPSGEPSAIGTSTSPSPSGITGHPNR